MDKNGKWTTKDGIEMYIKDMETSHIKNTINLLKKAMKNAMTEDDEVYTADHWSFFDASYTHIGKKTYRKKIKEFEKELSKRLIIKIG